MLRRSTDAGCAAVSQMAAVRRSCQTKAGAMGRPVARSQTIVVSRWLVRPMAAIRSAFTPASSKASVTCEPTEPIRASGSCSTQPELRVTWQNLGLALSHRLQPCVVDNRPRARRSLVDHQNMVACHEPFPSDTMADGSRITIRSEANHGEDDDLRNAGLPARLPGNWHRLLRGSFRDSPGENEAGARTQGTDEGSRDGPQPAGRCFLALSAPRGCWSPPWFLSAYSARPSCPAWP